jgi:hypothetical protein
MCVVRAVGLKAGSPGNSVQLKWQQPPLQAKPERCGNKYEYFESLRGGIKEAGQKTQTNGFFVIRVERTREQIILKLVRSAQDNV